MKYITDKAVFNDLINGDRPVLVDFYAEWCGPCGMIAPVIEQIAAEHKEIEVVKVNVDNAVEIAAEYGIVSIPTVIFFKNGSETKRIIGAADKSEYEDLISE